MEETSPQVPSGVADGRAVVADLAPGIELLGQAVQALDLSMVTWYALHLAERAQFWASHALNTDETRFMSLNGMLCDESGRIVSLETGDLQRLAKAFEEAS